MTILGELLKVEWECVGSLMDESEVMSLPPKQLLHCRLEGLTVQSLMASSEAVSLQDNAESLEQAPQSFLTYPDRNLGNVCEHRY